MLVFLSTTTLTSCLVHFLFGIFKQNHNLLYFNEINIICETVKFCAFNIIKRDILRVGNQVLGSVSTTVLISSDSNACPSENSRSTSVITRKIITCNYML